jgi:hypothetical protein
MSPAVTSHIPLARSFKLPGYLLLFTRSNRYTPSIPLIAESSLFTPSEISSWHSFPWRFVSPGNLSRHRHPIQLKTSSFLTAPPASSRHILLWTFLLLTFLPLSCSRHFQSFIPTLYLRTYVQCTSLPPVPLFLPLSLFLSLWCLSISHHIGNVQSYHDVVCKQAKYQMEISNRIGNENVKYLGVVMKLSLGVPHLIS